MQNAYLIDARRTPFGSFGGTLATVLAPQLAAQVIRYLLEAHDLPNDSIDEVIIGQVLQGGTGQAPARQAMRAAGLPDSVHAMTINKVCGSGLKSIMLAADTVRLGEASMVVAGGMENMSLAPYLLPKARFGHRMGHMNTLDMMIHDGLQDPYSNRHMGEITEAWIARHAISRSDQDAYAARSYQLAQSAVANGTFKDELVAVTKQDRKGETTVEQDEEPGRGNIAKLSEMRSVFSTDGTITAGNASTINDGAALALVCNQAAIGRYNLVPRARIVASSTYSTDPDDFAEAPVGAMRAVLKKAGLSLGQMELFEINEAFAAVPLLAIRQLGIDIERVNVHGGAVAIGHPIGASGARLAATLVREMHVRQLRYGLASLCIGGGEAVAVIFERC